jgi:hypothetical protein
MPLGQSIYHRAGMKRSRVKKAPPERGVGGWALWSGMNGSMGILFRKASYTIIALRLAEPFFLNTIKIFLL